MGFWFDERSGGAAAPPYRQGETKTPLFIKAGLN
jgi:hypothetical protein